MSGFCGKDCVGRVKKIGVFYMIFWGGLWILIQFTIHGTIFYKRGIMVSVSARREGLPPNTSRRDVTIHSPIL